MGLLNLTGLAPRAAKRLEVVPGEVVAVDPVRPIAIGDIELAVVAEGDIRGDVGKVFRCVLAKLRRRALLPDDGAVELRLHDDPMGDVAVIEVFVLALFAQVETVGPTLEAVAP